MPETGILDIYAAPFTQRLAGRAELLVREALVQVARDVPELVGPGPLPAELLAQVFASLLDTVGAAISCRAPLDNPFVPPVAVQYARVLAQRGVPADRILRGYEVARGVIVHEFIECAAAVVEDRDDLTRMVEAVLAYGRAYSSATLQAAMAEHAAAVGAWPHNREGSLTHRLNAVLDGRVKDAEVAERMLGYPVTGHHVALMIWLDGEPGSRPDPKAAHRHLRALPEVRDALVVPRDEQTLLCWLMASHDAPIDEWLKTGVAPSHTSRVALGEPGAGIEGFCLSHRQARAAGIVLSLARRELGPVVRYRDVSAISFLVDQPIECDGWVHAVLGDLAETGEEKERLRRTLRVYLEEGENVAATARRLFMHRNTVKYRLEQASEMLPQPIEDRRLDIALALRYCEWVPILCGAGGAPSTG